MKKCIPFLFAGFLLLIVADSSHAFDLANGNGLWGKYAIQTCRSCHREKGLTSLDPRERSADKWEEFFVNDYKKLREIDHDFVAVGINDRQLENIHRYLVDTAAKESSAAIAGTSGKSKKYTYKNRKSTRSSSVQKIGSGKKFDMAAGNAGKGRYIFRKCLACHKRNDAPIVSPGDRTKKAWGRYFTNDYRKLRRYMPDFDTYKYSVSQMQHLHQFFLKYALDADKPKTCE